MVWDWQISIDKLDIVSYYLGSNRFTQGNETGKHYELIIQH
ncbi:hypothetical protein P4U90_22715 [Cytobacillus kochii]|nr:hypothetical protein [Cytobacillus kochii]MED1608131.1 hypothetical protein [Cytobacillus kochii]